jgi:hypothetical protein
MSEDSTPNFTSESSKTTAGSTAADRAQELSDIKLLLTNIRDSIAELTGDVGRLGDDITDISDATEYVSIADMLRDAWGELRDLSIALDTLRDEIAELGGLIEEAGDPCEGEDAELIDAEITRPSPYSDGGV